MTTASKPLQTLRVSLKTRMMWLLLAVAGLAIIGIEIARDSPPMFRFPFVLVLLMAIWSHRAEVVKVYDRYIEVKLGPFAGSKRVLFTEIQKLEETKRVAKITYGNKGRSKSLKLPFSMLEPDDKEWLLDEIEQALAA